MNAPFTIASFVGLVALPDLVLTELGLVDCKTQAWMDDLLSDDMTVQDHRDSSISGPVKICCHCPSHAHNVHRMMDCDIAGACSVITHKTILDVVIKYKASKSAVNAMSSVSYLHRYAGMCFPYQHQSSPL